MDKKFRVIKDIPEGWETSAAVGDILTVQNWNRDLTLMKGSKAVCDIDSEYGRNYCEEIE
ncbi:hypothetical protein [Bacillus infantis]|uniref:hypothetical protein n=1 Tax=Bacillus infantis TaxID=324767 RepID=UPI003CE94357